MKSKFNLLTLIAVLFAGPVVADDNVRFGVSRDLNDTGSTVITIRANAEGSRFGVNVIGWATEPTGDGERFETLTYCANVDPDTFECLATYDVQASQTPSYGIGVDYEFAVTRNNLIGVGAVYIDETTKLNPEPTSALLRWSYQVMPNFLVSATAIGTTRDAWKFIGLEYRF